MTPLDTNDPNEEIGKVVKPVFLPEDTDGDMDEDELSESVIKYHLFDDAFYNWLLASGVDLWVKSSEMNSSAIGGYITGEIDMSKLKASIMEYAMEAARTVTALNDLKPSDPADSLRPSESHILDTIKTDIKGRSLDNLELYELQNGKKLGPVIPLTEVLAIIDKHKGDME